VLRGMAGTSRHACWQSSTPAAAGASECYI
jgi:hypothetical protein